MSPPFVLIWLYRTIPDDSQFISGEWQTNLVDGDHNIALILLTERRHWAAAHAERINSMDAGDMAAGDSSVTLFRLKMHMILFLDSLLDVVCTYYCVALVTCLVSITHRWFQLIKNYKYSVNQDCMHHVYEWRTYEHLGRVHTTSLWPDRKRFAACCPGHWRNRNARSGF